MYASIFTVPEADALPSGIMPLGVAIAAAALEAVTPVSDVGCNSDIKLAAALDATTPTNAPLTMIPKPATAAVAATPTNTVLASMRGVLASGLPARG